MKETLFHSGFWTTVLFIILQITGITAFSWWWVLVTLFAPPIAWVAVIVWLIQILI